MQPGPGSLETKAGPSHSALRQGAGGTWGLLCKAKMKLGFCFAGWTPSSLAGRGGQGKSPFGA